VPEAREDDTDGDGTARWRGGDSRDGEAPVTFTPVHALSTISLCSRRAGSRGSILIVEDDLDIREALAEALGFEGYDVLLAENGQEALDVLRVGPLPHVILLDLLMPVMNGWEFRQEQLADPALAGIPVVVVSASAPGDARPDRYLPKPFSIDELLVAVAELSAEDLQRSG
jgi:CheY-like chemotaxis protein